MHTFEFVRPKDPAAAIAAAAEAKTAQQGADIRFVAGGTTLIDLMKLNVETPARLIDINRLPLDRIEATSDGGLKIGATARNSDLAHHPTVQRDYSVLSQAVLAGASAQLRTVGRPGRPCSPGARGRHCHRRSKVCGTAGRRPPHVGRRSGRHPA